MRSSIRLIMFILFAGSAAAGLAAGCGDNGGSGGSGAGHSGTGGLGHGGGGGSGAGATGTGAGATGTGAGATGTGAGATGTGAGATGTGGTSTSSGTSSGGPCVPTNCQGHVYACGDCVDNDGDGLVDADDPDCLGPCDNTEDSYFGGIPGQNNAPCKMDCYFDQDTGSGNDDCYWNHACDPHETSPNYYPEHDNGSQCTYDPNAHTPGSSKSCDELYNAQSDTCMNYCGPLTPNGCDCFGCCELPAGTGKYVWLGSTINGVGSCDLAHVSDPTKCQPCQPVKACLNTCEHCELCLGKTTLPPDCFPDGGSTSSSSSGGTGGSSSTGSGGSTTSSSGSASSSSGGTGQCDVGVQPCGLPGQSPCPIGTYCITGCCQQIPK